MIMLEGVPDVTGVKLLIAGKTACEDLIVIVETKMTDGSFKELLSGTIA